MPECFYINSASEGSLNATGGASDLEKPADDEKMQLPVTSDIAIEALCKEVCGLKVLKLESRIFSTCFRMTLNYM